MRAGASNERACSIEFLFQSAEVGGTMSTSAILRFPYRSSFTCAIFQLLQVSPIVKYTALSLFASRFLPSLDRIMHRNGKGNMVLLSMEESNFQLYGLISLWISSKIHESRPLSVKQLKFLGDKFIKEQHFTTRDFLDAGLSFEIGALDVAFIYLEELYYQFKGLAKLGELLSFEACMDLMDLLYEKDETTVLFKSPCALAASILIASYIITVPKQQPEFPILPWVKFVTSCKEDDILEVVSFILQHALQPSC